MLIKVGRESSMKSIEVLERKRENFGSKTIVIVNRHTTYREKSQVEGVQVSFITTLAKARQNANVSHLFKKLIEFIGMTVVHNHAGFQGTTQQHFACAHRPNEVSFRPNKRVPFIGTDDAFIQKAFIGCLLEKE